MSQTIFPVHVERTTTISPSAMSSGTRPGGSVIKLTQSLSPISAQRNVAERERKHHQHHARIAAPGASFVQPSGWTCCGHLHREQCPESSSLDTLYPVRRILNWTTNYWPWQNSYFNYQIRDDVSWTHGQHSFKFGFGYMRNDKNQQQQADTQGDYHLQPVVPIR